VHWDDSGRGPRSCRRALAWYAVQLYLNALWSTVFFGPGTPRMGDRGSREGGVQVNCSPTSKRDLSESTSALTLGPSVRRLRRVQRLSASIDAAWGFFSDPANLARITPPGLGFEVTSPLPEHIYTGQIVTYRVRPLFGVPVTWVTEIAAVDAPHRFVDEQRVGPYRFWHHQHHLREVDGGVEVEDIVHYALPFGPVGAIVDRLLVLPRLHRIFAYRGRVLADTFGELATPGPRRSVATLAGADR